METNHISNTMLKQGDKLPQVSVSGHNIIANTLITDLPRPFVLFFYPKNNTPGCTQENIDFSAYFQQFYKLKISLIGVSRDTTRSHERFAAKHQLPYPLISDHNEELCLAFGVIRQKKMFGKTVRGIIRSTFYINKDGIIDKAWHKVKVPQHVEDVLEYAKTQVAGT